jgi:outer membrane protein assembly factor BamB
MKLRGFIRGVAPILLILLLALALATCGGRKHKAPVVPELTGGGAQPQPRQEVSLDQALAELEAMTGPEGVNEGIFQQLKDELARQLVARGEGKIVSTPPGENSRVTDLDLIDNWDGTYSLVWHYYNLGDYDQNGTVAISDITPIAVHFGEQVPPGGKDSLTGVIDGSGNGVVDIADITPIAQGFMRDVAGYRAEGTTSLLDPWEWVDDTPYESAVGTGRKRFDLRLNYIDYQTYHVVPYDSAWEDGAASNDTLSSHSVEVFGTVVWDTGGVVEGAHVTARTSDGSSAGEVDTDSSGGFMVELAPVAFNVKVVVQADYDDATTGLTLTNFRTTDELAQPGVVDSLVVTLPDPAGSELTVAGDHAESAGGDIVLDNLPGEVERVYARAYDPDVDEDAFPGDFEDGSLLSLNSSAFMWITGQDSGGGQVDELSDTADVRLEIPQTQWGDLADIFPNNGQIDVPIYDMNYETGFWEAQQNGYLVDETGAVLAEDMEPDITSGAYSGRIFAHFGVDHFSFWNCDYPYIYVWTLSRLSPELRNTECFYKAVTLAETIAKSQKGRDAYAKVNKTGATMESDYLTDGQPDNANKKAPEIKTRPTMRWNQEVTKNGQTVHETLLGDYWGRVNGHRQDEVFINSKLWDMCAPGSTQEEKQIAVLLMAKTILHETAHQKQHLKKQEPEPYEVGWQLEKDIFGGRISYFPNDGLTIDEMPAEHLLVDWLDPTYWPAASGGSSLRSGSDVGDSGLTNVIFRNDGSVPIEVLPGIFGINIPVSFEITNELAEPVEWVGPCLNLDFSSDSYLTLNPGEQVTDSWDLRYDDDGHPWRYDLFETGAYEIKAVYSEFLPPYDPVESNTLEVMVEFYPPGTITGTVRDAVTSNGVPDATVRALVGSFCLGTAASDVNGDYTIAGLQPVTYTVEAYGHNHALDTLTGVAVVSEQTTSGVDFALEPAQRGDWWMLGRDPGHQSRSPFAAAQTNNLRWNCPLGDGVSYSSPAIGADGTVYVGCEDYSLYAVTPAGDVDWSYETGGSIESSPAIGLDGTIYFGSYDAYFYALNPNGTLRWRYALGEPDWHWVRSSPAIAPDGTVYVGGTDSYLYAFEPGGTLLWRYFAGGPVDPGIAVSPEGTVYVNGWDEPQNTLSAVTPDGDLKWTYEVDSFVSCTPAVAADGTVYFSTVEGRIYALNPDGTLKWRVWGVEGSLTGTRSSPAIAADGTIYIGVHDVINWFDTYLLALNPDGSVKWLAPTESTVDAIPAIGADGAVYVGDTNYNFKAYNPGDGSVLWDYVAGDWIQSGAAIGEDGTVYVGCWDGYLYAFGS